MGFLPRFRDGPGRWEKTILLLGIQSELIFVFHSGKQNSWLKNGPGLKMYFILKMGILLC